jgi:hypothetical protein
MRRSNINKKPASNKEVWAHWACKKRWWELSPQEREKCIHWEVMTYVDSTKRQWFAWSGSWRGIHPVCGWCGHMFGPDDIYFDSVEEFKEWKEALIRN